MQGMPFSFFAPMEGVTHPTLRHLMAARGGIDVVCTEFVRVSGQPLARKVLAKHVVRPPHGLLSVQVMGNHIEHMADATALVTDAGADIVDINLGCPAPKAVRKGVGSAMLTNLPLLGKVLTSMRRRTHLPMSAKIRAGLDDASRVLDVARVVQDCGADFITVHPRRRVDFYSGVADWRIVRRLVEHLSIPVVGNGDIWYAADALRMQQETGCSGVMLGRPALRNPFIFLQIEALRGGAQPPAVDGDMLVCHLESLAEKLAELLPESSVAGMLKEQLRYVGRALFDRGSLLREACRAPTTAAILALLEERLRPLSSREVDLAAQGGTLERAGSALPDASPYGLVPAPLAAS